MAAVKNPTYMEHIRHFFEAEDHECMFKRGKDYTTYESLKNHAIEVYSITRPPNAKMPKPPDRRWSKDRSDTFLNWIQNEQPRGEPKPKAPSTGTAGRVRRNASDLGADDIKLLAKAFTGIMDRATTDPTGYFQIAGIHWYPDITWCQHHVPHYHMWHRAYLLQFENALRSVAGCEDVTLPYWDIIKPVPAFLYRAPFRSYTLPERVHANYDKGYTTKRHTAAQIAKNVKAERIPSTIDGALKQSGWETFNDRIQGAHDSGHPACGASMAGTDVAAFDPLFWFFHSNWDRLWWRWQQIMQATTIWTFRSTFTDPGTGNFFVPPLNKLKPKFMDAEETIDLEAIGVTYTQPPSAAPEISAASFGSLLAVPGFAAASSPTMSVRVRGIDRLVIPGSFRVRLTADGTSIAQRSFFQSTSPRECDTCRKNGEINMDFLVPLDSILGARVGVSIEVFDRDGRAQPFPLSSVGNPTVNARLPLEK